MAKKIAKYLFIFVFLAGSAWAYEGVMWGEKDIRVVKTEWFDIIYLEECRESAALLAENADRIYREIADLYGRPPQFRLPVVLSANREDGLSFYSPAFSNHIAIREAQPVEGIEVFSNDLLSVFRHELTHAYTLNMKSDGWRGVSRVFSDALNPAWLFITFGWMEGATLTSESSKGEGRLNNEYSRHVFKQAKIEKKFPAYDDVQSSRDKYPSGAFYEFNGAFNEWLQKKYGMEKYAAFWYKCVNFKTISTRLAFKKIYGIKLTKAWKQFRDELPVPETPPSPLDFEGADISDFFTGKKSFSMKNNAGFVFSRVTASDNAVLWLDKKSGIVWTVSKSEAQRERPKVKRLFQVRNALDLSVSQDGRFVAVKYVNQQDAYYTYRVRVYDTEKRSWLKFDDTGVHDAAIIKEGVDYYLVMEKFRSQKAKIVIRRLTYHGRWIDLPDGAAAMKASAKEQGFAKKRDVFATRAGDVEIPLELNEMSAGFVQIADGVFAYVHRKGLEYTIRAMNVAGGVVFERRLPHERMVIKNLSFDAEENTLYFSYTVPGSMPRLGSHNIARSAFLLDNTDLSGGVFYPVRLGADEFLYVGEFYNMSRLFKIKSAGVLAGAGAGQTARMLPTPTPPTEPPVTLKGSVDDILAGAEKYEGLKYSLQGLLLPFGLVASQSFDMRSDDFETTRYLALGGSYIMTSPLNSHLVILSTGYSMFTNSAGIEASIHGGTNSSLFRWNASSQSEFDFGGWKQSNIMAGISFVYPVGKYSSVSITDNATVFAGRGNENTFTLIPPDLSKPVRIFPTSSNLDQIFYARNKATFLFSSVRRTGAGTFESGGLSAGVSLIYEASFDMKDIDAFNVSVFNVSPFVTIAIPKLLPIDSRDGFVYNFPLTLRLSAFDKANQFLKATARAVVFSYDVQKAIPVLSAIYVNRFYFTLGYDFSVPKAPTTLGILETPDLIANLAGGFKYTDYIFLDTTLGLTPNFGALANTTFYSRLTLQTRFYPQRAGQAGRIGFNFNFATSLSF